MEVTLSKDGKKIEETTHIKYTVFDEYLIIFIKDITKSDAGTYSLTVKNDSGSVSASFTVYITGNMLSVSSLCLSSQLACYIIIMFDEIRFAWSSNWSTGSVRYYQTHLYAHLEAS